MWWGRTSNAPRMPIVADLPPIDAELPTPEAKLSKWHPGWSTGASIIAVVVWIAVGLTTGRSYFPVLVAALLVIFLIDRVLRRRAL